MDDIISNLKVSVSHKLAKSSWMVLAPQFSKGYKVDLTLARRSTSNRVHLHGDTSL